MLRSWRLLWGSTPGLPSRLRRACHQTRSGTTPSPSFARLTTAELVISFLCKKLHELLAVRNTTRCLLHKVSQNGLLMHLYHAVRGDICSCMYIGRHLNTGSLAIFCHHESIISCKYIGRHLIPGNLVDLMPSSGHIIPAIVVAGDSGAV